MNADIILADDERPVRRSLVGLLEGAGYAVRAAKDGEEALRLYRERRPDLMLLDVMMPKRSGLRSMRGGSQDRRRYARPLPDGA